MKERKQACFSGLSGWWRAAAVVSQLQLQALAGRRPRPHSAGQQPMPWAVCVLKDRVSVSVSLGTQIILQPNLKQRRMNSSIMYAKLFLATELFLNRCVNEEGSEGQGWTGSVKFGQISLLSWSLGHRLFHC